MEPTVKNINKNGLGAPKRQVKKLHPNQTFWSAATFNVTEGQFKTAEQKTIKWSMFTCANSKVKKTLISLGELNFLTTLHPDQRLTCK